MNKISRKNMFILFIFFFLIFLAVTKYQSSTPTPFVKVAILDTGILKEHESFQGVSFKSYDAIGKSETNEVSDRNGHGTAITSTFLDSFSKIKHGSIMIYDVKVLNDEGLGNPEDTIAGIKWAFEQDVDIINISAGFQTPNLKLEKAIANAIEHGIVVVASAGNNLGFDADFPARLTGVISVSSVTEDKQKSITSSIGKIDFVTIGQNVQAANIEGSTSTNSGSSFATVKIASYLAEKMLGDSKLLKNPTKAYQVLIESTEDLGEAGDDEIYGKGYIKIN